MWRKIHSNRDPRDTLFRELRKEFRPWFERLSMATKALIAGNPKAAFSVMIILLVLSSVLSFTVFRYREAKHPAILPAQPAVVSDGFSRIMLAAGKLKETIGLKRIVDSLTSKSQLSAADSILLDSVLNRLQQVQKPHK